jgi:hypothetical protein
MRQKNNSHNSLKCSGFSLNEGHISRSNFRVISPALLKDFSNSSTHLGKGFKTSIKGIPKRNLDCILHYLLLQQIKNSKHSFSSSFSCKRHHFFLFQYHKNFQLAGRLRGNALSLIQSQYAKKKRNPE